MTQDRALLQRFEMKYLVSESTALRARQFLRGQMEPDEFAKFSDDHAYPVHSTYLDSPDLHTYRAVNAGEKNRFKLRIRYYGDKDQAVFFEIKHRKNEIIEKTRVKVYREAVRPLLMGQPPQMKHLANPNAKQFEGLLEFVRLMHKLRATPRSHVAYRREAWMSRHDNSLRITFDRAVRCEPEFAPSLRTHFTGGVTPFQKQVILELKFTDRLPAWCTEMIQSLNLWRSGAPKYAMGIMVMGEHRLSNMNVGIKVPAPATTRPDRWTQPQTEPMAVPAA
jgi:hypothetical protein